MVKHFLLRDISKFEYSDVAPSNKFEHIEILCRNLNNGKNRLCKRCCALCTDRLSNLWQCAWILRGTENFNSWKVFSCNEWEEGRSWLFQCVHFFTAISVRLNVTICCVRLFMDVCFYGAKCSAKTFQISIPNSLILSLDPVPSINQIGIFSRRILPHFCCWYCSRTGGGGG